MFEQNKNNVSNLIEKKLSGIYCIENILNHKKYIGQSKNIHRRFIMIKSNLRGNVFHNVYLQNDFNKFGEDMFHFYLLEKCDTLLDNKERYYIKIYNTLDKEYGYNSLSGGKSGFTLSKELSQIKSQKLLGNNNRKGIPHTSHTKKKIALSEQGIKIGNQKYVGVHLNKKTNKWRARIKVNQKEIHLGYFISEKDAAIAYNNGAIKYFGKNAKLNMIGDYK